MHFYEWKVLYFDSNFTDVWSQATNWQKVSIVLGNGLVPSRQQAITWTNVGLVHWRMYICMSVNQGLVSLTVFPSQFKFDGNFVSLSPDSNTVIVTTLCTWHDSCAVVAVAKWCCDVMVSNGITARRSYHRIWIAEKNRQWNEPLISTGAKVFLSQSHIRHQANMGWYPFDTWIKDSR